MNAVNADHIATALHVKGVFAPGPAQHYLCLFHSVRPIREEEDHDLYFDAETLELFVVVSHEVESGPIATASYSIFNLQDYLKEWPRHRSLIATSILQKLGLIGHTQ